MFKVYLYVDFKVGIILYSLLGCLSNYNVGYGVDSVD